MMFGLWFSLKVHGLQIGARDFGGVSSCLANGFRVFPAELAVQNVVDFFASTYHELVDTTFSYLLFAA